MTDTHAPLTGPLPAPMFDTGPHPSPSPNTEPHHAPIFDTGPHPGPLQPLGSSAGTGPPSISQPQAVLADAVQYADADADDLAAAALAAAALADAEAAPSGSHPFESHPETSHPEAPAPQAFSELDNVDTDAFLRSVTGHLQPGVVLAQPVAVPSSYQFVKRWKFALIVAGVWLLAAAAGLGFYYWWYTALVKTLPVFGILLYVVVCMVAAVLVSMVPNRPQVSALALALMAAPLASTAAAAVLHGAYFFEWIARPLVG